MIQEGVNGCLVNVDDPDAYAEAICRLFSFRTIDSRAIRKSIEPYADHNVIQELRAIYSSSHNTRDFSRRRHLQ